MRKRFFFKKNWRSELTVGLIIFFLVFGSLFTSVLPVNATPLATITAENITLDTNSYAVVGVYADNIPSPGLAGYDLDLNYDPSQIQIVGITRSASFSPPTPEFNDLNPSPVPGKVTVVYASSSGTTGNFKLFNVKVKALRPLTNASPFTISVKDFCRPDLLNLTPTLHGTRIPVEPDVSADNHNNLIIGLAAGMEYLIDNSSFTPFVSGSLPNLSGDHTVFVRLAGTTTSPPGAEKMLKFTTLAQVAIPQAVVGTTTYNSGNHDYIATGVTIHLTSATPEAEFFYTIGVSGSVPGNPTVGGTAYFDFSGIPIPDGKTIIRAYAVKDGMADSNIATFTFINKVSMPYIMVGGLQYKFEGTPTSLSVPQGVPVFLGSSTGSDVSFYYTTDGSAPTTGSTLCNPLTGITNLALGTTTLKVLGTKSSLANSGIATFLVTVTQPTVSTAPLASQLSVVNNPAGTNDTVTVQALSGGDIVKVYADATTQTFLGTATQNETTDPVIVNITQLGTTAGTVYVSVTSPGKSESSRTEVAYSAEVINPVTPEAPNVTRDDTANTVSGMATGMEYNLDGAGYVAYNATTFNALDLSGVHTLLVRVAAEGINPAGPDTTLTFTTNPVTPAVPNVTRDDTANTVAGMAAGMEYNLDGAGYVAYNATTFNALDLSGVHTLLVRVAAEGVNPVSEAVTLSFTANSESLNVTIGNASGRAGQNVTVNINLTNVEDNADLGIVTSMLTVNYDETALQLVSTTSGSIVPAGAVLSANPTNEEITAGTNPGQIVFVEEDGTQGTYLIKTDGTFITIVFKIKDTATVGTYPITFSSVSTDNSLTKMTEDINNPVDDITGFVLIPGSVNVVQWLYGDLNGSGGINSTDYALLKSYLLKKITQFSNGVPLQAADLNGSGGINSTDYALLKSYLLKKISKFPVEP